MKIPKSGFKYLSYLPLLLSGVCATAAAQSQNLVNNGNFYTLQNWQHAAVTLRHDVTPHASCQDTVSNDSQCPRTGHKTLACLKSDVKVNMPYADSTLSQQNLFYANTYLRQQLTTPLQPNTRYRFSFKAVRPVSANSVDKKPAQILSSIGVGNGWPKARTTYANWNTPAPAVIFNGNQLASSSANHGSGFYYFAQPQTLEFVTPSGIAAGEEYPSIQFAYAHPGNTDNNTLNDSSKKTSRHNSDGICITDVSLEKIPAPNLNSAKVSVNNYGYLNNLPKRATVANLPNHAVKWQLVSEFENRVLVRKEALLPAATADGDSGDRLATVDFSDYTATSLDPRFRIRVIDNKPRCDLGSYDSANCYVATPPAGSSPFIHNNNLYHTPLLGANRCPLTFPGSGSDGANCYIAKPPAGSRPFIHAGNLYYTRLSGTNPCPLAGSHFDGANCFVATPPSGTSPFIHSGNLYHSWQKNYCPLKDTWFDGANCFVGKTPPGSSPFIWSGNLYVKPNGIGNVIVQSPLFRIADKQLYSPLKKDALSSFYHQRSNERVTPTPDGENFSNLWQMAFGNLWHEKGNAGDNQVGCYAGTDLHGNTWPGCGERTFNVSNGWYDAADHGKYVVNGGVSLWTLQNLAERLQKKGTLNSAFPRGMMNFRSTSYGLHPYSDLLTEIRHQMEFMLSMQIPADEGVTMTLPVGYQATSATGLPSGSWSNTRPAKGVYQVKVENGVKQYANRSVPGSIAYNGGYVPRLEIALEFTPNVDTGGMAFHSVTDRCWTGIPINPASYDVNCNGQDPHNNTFYSSSNTAKRVLRYPTTAATLNLAATAAQCYRVWKNVANDGGLADRCLQAAQTAWDAAVRVRREHGDIFRYEYQNTGTSDSWSAVDNGRNIKTLEHGFAFSPMFLGGGNYGDLRLRDEYYWAAMELYLATGDITYLRHADSFMSSGRLAEDDRGRGDYGQYSASSQSGFAVYHYDWINGFNWQNVAPLGSLSALVAEPETFAHTGTLTLPGLTAARTSPLTNLLTFANSIVTQQIERPASYKVPAKAYNFADNNTNYPWGSNGEILNRALILGLAADYAPAQDREKYRAGVSAAMNYLMGHNPLTLSYISGYGANAFNNPHHRFFAKHAFKKDSNNNVIVKGIEWAQVPRGFVAGGPNTRDMASVEAGATRDANGNIDDPSAHYFLTTTRNQCLNRTQTDGSVYPLRCYTDHWLDFATNEVAINWQAPLVWVSQYLSE